MSTVTVNDEARLYVLHSDEGGFSHYGFDNAADELERITLELVGRGQLDATFIDNPPKYELGSYALWFALMGARKTLQAVCEKQGDRATCGLSPQLQGLEGHRVEVIREGGGRARFIVGKSTGWMPCHLEIARIDSMGGAPADREYQRVVDLGRVR